MVGLPADREWTFLEINTFNHATAYAEITLSPLEHNNANIIHVIFQLMCPQVKLDFIIKNYCQTYVNKLSCTKRIFQVVKVKSCAWFKGKKSTLTLSCEASILQPVLILLMWLQYYSQRETQFLRYLCLTNEDLPLALFVGVIAHKSGCKIQTNLKITTTKNKLKSLNMDTNESQDSDTLLQFPSELLPLQWPQGGLCMSVL